MHLNELLPRILVDNIQADSAPDWMLGCFKRRCISFADGTSDIDTQVFWLQSRNLTIDLRLPSHPLPSVPVQQFSLAQLNDYYWQEGWIARSSWNRGQLQWQGGTSFQPYDRWPEPAILSRVGNCMMEFAPSGIYVEDWRLQNERSGPLLSLELVHEKNLANNLVTRKGGGLIICGDYAALVIGRTPLGHDFLARQPSGLTQLSQLHDNYKHDTEKLKAINHFTAALAKGSIDQGFRVTHSLHSVDVGRTLMSMTGFELGAEPNTIIHTLIENDLELERLYRIDSGILAFPFSFKTEAHAKSKTWHQQEISHLGRYTKTLL